MSAAFYCSYVVVVVALLMLIVGVERVSSQCTGFLPCGESCTCPDMNLGICKPDNANNVCVCDCGTSPTPEHVPPPTPQPPTPLPTPQPCQCLEQYNYNACWACRTFPGETRFIEIKVVPRPSDCSCGKDYRMECMNAIEDVDCQFDQLYTQASITCLSDVMGPYCERVDRQVVTTFSQCLGNPCPTPIVTRDPASACCDSPSPYPTPVDPTPRPTPKPSPRISTTTPQPRSSSTPTRSTFSLRSSTLTSTSASSQQSRTTSRLPCDELTCGECVTALNCLWCASSAACLDAATNLDNMNCGRLSTTCAVKLSLTPLGNGPTLTSLAFGAQPVTVTAESNVANQLANGVALIKPGMPFRLMFEPAVALARIGLIDLAESESGTLRVQSADGTSVSVTIKDLLNDVHGVTKGGCSALEISSNGMSQFGVSLIELEAAEAQSTTSVSSTMIDGTADTSTVVIEASDTSNGTGVLDGLTIGLIAGGVALVLIMLLALAAWIVRRRRGVTGQSSSATGRDWLQESGTTMPSRTQEYSSISPVRTQEYGNVELHQNSGILKKTNVYDSAETPLN
jgi:hypothetical protein